MCRDAKKAQAFYGEVLGWKAALFPMGNVNYEMILAGDTLDTMIGGYAAPKNGRQRPPSAKDRNSEHTSLGRCWARPSICRSGPP